MRTLLAHTRGIVMLEFVMVMVPLMLAFLGGVQFAFVATAKMTLRHSATLAVRAASVVIEESGKLEGVRPDIYEGLPAGLLEVEDPDESDSEADLSRLASAQDSIASDVSAPDSTASDASAPDSTASDDPIPALQSLFGVLDRSESRINQIRTAAYIPMLAISPDALSDMAVLVADPLADFDKRWAGNDNVENAIGDASATRLLGAFLYNLGALAVTFDAGDTGGDEPQAQVGEVELDQLESDEAATIEYAPGADVTVRISYLFRCKVPLVSVLMCNSGWAIHMGSAWFDPQTYWELREVVQEPPQTYQEVAEWEQKLSAAQDSFGQRQERLDRVGEAKRHWKQVEVPLMQTLLLFRPGARYLVLSSEATLPLQSARYYPRLEDPENSQDSANIGDFEDFSGAI